MSGKLDHAVNRGRCPRGGMRDGRVLSRKSPGTPSRMNRSCQRQTHGFDLPVRRMILAVPHPPAVARMILARQTCFCRLFRSATTASKRARSVALTSTLIPSRILNRWGRAWLSEILRQARSTSHQINNPCLKEQGILAFFPCVRRKRRGMRPGEIYGI
jgi:hypothetical protein